MKKLRVVIADDSQVIRSLLCKILFADNDIEVVGVAANGEEAFGIIKALKPDIATIDINMPKMDGLEAIEAIMREFPVPILVISGVSDSPAAFAALTKGALDVIPKSYTKPEKAQELIRKVKVLAKVRVARLVPSKKRPTDADFIRPSKTYILGFSKVVAIACSTGGPRALSVILSQLPGDYPYPILIAQHMEEVFVDGLVSWMKRVTPLTVKKATANEKITPGSVFISPADKSMEIDESSRIRLVNESDSDICLPSCNRLLTSVGSVFCERSIGIILTGMGNDGAEGIRVIKQEGGRTIAQDKKTSTIFGMPNQAIKTGCVDHILPLQDIGNYLNKLLSQETSKLKQPSVGRYL